MRAHFSALCLLPLVGTPSRPGIATSSSVLPPSRDLPWPLAVQRFPGLPASQHSAPLWPRAWHTGPSTVVIAWLNEKQKIILEMWKLRIGHFSKFPQISSRRGPQHLVLDTLLTGGEGFSMLGGGAAQAAGMGSGLGSGSDSRHAGFGPPYDQLCASAPGTCRLWPSVKGANTMNLRPAWGLRAALGPFQGAEDQRNQSLVLCCCFCNHPKLNKQNPLQSSMVDRVDCFSDT